MANQAERPDIRHVARAAAFCHRYDVIGIPQRPAVDRLQPPVLQQPYFCCAAATLQRDKSSKRVDAAHRANALVTRQCLLAQESCICTQTPLLDAKIRAES